MTEQEHLIADVQAFLHLDAEATPEHHFVEGTVVYPGLEAEDEDEQWVAHGLAMYLGQIARERIASGIPLPTPQELVCIKQTFVKEWGWDDPHFPFQYVAGALRREIAWYDELKHYEEWPAIEKEKTPYRVLLPIVNAAQEQEPG